MAACRIQDYALIGNGRSAALISRAGSLDWLCWPRFDSPALFAGLLDEHKGGRWQIAPTSKFHVRRHYVDDTNVLETRFETAGGEVVLTDLMPVASVEETRWLMLPEHELLRRVQCERGEVELEVVFDPRPDFGRIQPRFRDLGHLGLRVEHGARLHLLRSPLRLSPREGGGMGARFRLRAGEAVDFSLVFASSIAVLPPLGELALGAIDRTLRWWRRWVGRLRYDGPYRQDVVRSALALKLLTYAPSGAIIAAPTTSLPERIGGELNWDYRYCWVRDAAFTVRALCGLGYHDEARTFAAWLVHTTRNTHPDLHILYDVYGRRMRPEVTLDWLDGYRGSRPVRIHNAASQQLQLDTFGEVIDATAQLSCGGEPLDRETQKMLVGLGRYVCKTWRQPDDSIWEVRGPRREYTHSRVLCWTALDRLLALHRAGQLVKAPVEDFARVREEIRREVEARAWSPRIQSYAQVLGGDTVDAALLLMSWYGFADASSERMRRTQRLIRERLEVGPGLLLRYEQSRDVCEGAFGVCSFWEIEHLALGGGTLEEARRRFENVLPYSNDVGLFAEEIDPATGEALGNFPQAFTHVGLISAALSLEERAARERGQRAEPPPPPVEAQWEVSP